MEKLSMTLHNEQQGHTAFQTVWRLAKAHLSAGRRMVVKLEPETRSDEQNRRLWAMLTEISQQVNWHGIKPSAEDWKHILTAGLKKQRVAPGIDGGFVVLGLSTSKMTKAEMCELQDLIEAFGAQQGVTFSASPQEREQSSPKFSAT